MALYFSHQTLIVSCDKYMLRHLKNGSIILIGLPGCGKTTLGKKIAYKLNLPFIDTDAEIESIYSKTRKKHLSCPQIYAKEGKDFFRKLETKTLFSLHHKKRHVIATGGGLPLAEENQKALFSLGTIFYLKILPKIAWNRIKCERIPGFLNPLNPETSFFEMAKARLPIYEALADVIFDCKDTWPATLLEKFLKSLPGANPTEMQSAP